MGKSSKAVLKKGPWTREEDQKLMAYIEQHGHGSWCSLPAKAGLKRCGKSCRLRWTNYLRTDIKRGRFSMQEDQTIIQLQALLGNRWSTIALHLPNRTDNDIKNHWNTHLKKRLIKMGIDPTTHKPLNETLSKLNHMAQWETARLQAEARYVKQSKPRLHMVPPQSPLLPLPPCLDVLNASQNSWPSPTPVATVTTVGESSVGSLVRDDGDIMVAVEAFRSSRGYNCNNVMEGVDNNIIDEDVLLYGFNEKSPPQQERSCTDFEEKQYWESILTQLDH